MTVRITKLSLETLKLLENCTNCKINIVKNHFDEFYELVKEIEKEEFIFILIY